MQPRARRITRRSRAPVGDVASRRWSLCLAIAAEIEFPPRPAKCGWVVLGVGGHRSRGLMWPSPLRSRLPAQPRLLEVYLALELAQRVAGHRTLGAELRKRPPLGLDELAPDLAVGVAEVALTGNILVGRGLGLGLCEPHLVKLARTTKRLLRNATLAPELVSPLERCMDHPEARLDGTATRLLALRQTENAQERRQRKRDRHESPEDGRVAEKNQQFAVRKRVSSCRERDRQGRGHGNCASHSCKRDHGQLCPRRHWLAAYGTAGKCTQNERNRERPNC